MKKGDNSKYALCHVDKTLITSSIKTVDLYCYHDQIAEVCLNFKILYYEKETILFCFIGIRHGKNYSIIFLFFFFTNFNFMSSNFITNYSDIKNPNVKNRYLL